MLAKADDKADLAEPTAPTLWCSWKRITIGSRQSCRSFAPTFPRQALFRSLA